MVQPENVDRWHSNFQLGTRSSGCRHNLGYLLITCTLRARRAGTLAIERRPPTEVDRREFGGAQKVEKSIISRLAIAFVLALASVAANAQDTRSEQSQTPGV